MPPILALIFCSGFVLFLLWLEHKQSPAVTRALWIPTIWMLYIASKPLGVWFQQVSADAESGSPLDRTFLIILLFLALRILFQRGFDWHTAIKDNVWLLALVVLMFISILWSSIPAISFKRWIREFQAVIMAFVVLSEPSPRQAMESILRRTTYMLIPFSLLLIKYFPFYGVQYGYWSGLYMWIGVTLQKNGLGRLCFIAIFFLIWSLVRRWQGHNPPVWKYQSHTEILVLLLALWLIKGPGIVAYSATAVTSLALGLMVYWGLNLLRKSGKKLPASTIIIVTVTFIMVGLFAVFSGGLNLKFFTSSTGRDATLTGRTEVWAALLPVAMQRPILGHGSGGFWIPRTKEAFQISEAHSGYLEVLLDLGFVGILLVSMYILSYCRKAHRVLSLDYDWGALCVCFIIMFVVHNISESSINTFTSHLPALILFFSISLRTQFK